MKILFSSSKNTHLLAPQYVRELKGLEVDVESTFFFDVVSSFRKTLVGKLLLKICPSFVYHFSNQILLKDVKRINPQVLIIFKGMEIFPKTLKKIKEKKIFLINYNLDHPFKYFTKASGNTNVKNSIPLYDVLLTYSHQIKKEMNQTYPNANVEVLPFGYHTYVDGLKTPSTDIKKICFVGSADHSRASIIQFLIENNFQVDVFGEGWHKYLKSSTSLAVFPSVFHDKYWKTLGSYRVQLNLLRPHNSQSHNMRSFEIPAIGGIMLSMRTSEQMQFFEEKKEAFYFTDQQELINQLNFILNLPRLEADKIRQQARTKAAQHSYYHRSKNLLQIINHNLV